MHFFLGALKGLSSIISPDKDTIGTYNCNYCLIHEFKGEKVLLSTYKI